MGYFSIFRFLLPWQRDAKVRWFRSTYDDLVENRYADLGGDNHPSVVAHSFGTYILGYALLKYRNIRLDKVILCGSILPRNFPWQDIIERGQLRELRNEFGVKDVWVRLVKWFVKGAGSSGQNGFTQNGCKLQSRKIIQDEFIFEHSEYFNRGHMNEFWIPFLLRRPVPVSSPSTNKNVPLPSSPRPYGLIGIYMLILFGLAFCLSNFLEYPIFSPHRWIAEGTTGGTLPISFSFQYDWADKGNRKWTSKEDRWTEVQQDGSMNRFHNKGFAKIGDCAGMIAVGDDRPDFEVFIPAKQCALNRLRFRIGHEEWMYFGGPVYDVTY